MLAYVVLLLILICITYWFLTSVFDYWKKRSVPQPKVSILFGNVGDSIVMKRSIGEIYADIYKEYENFKYVGIYNFRSPALLIRDPNIIKTILVKEFNSFHDNDIALDGDENSILSKNPFVLKGDHWKIVRTQLTPCFTSGKVKSVFTLTENICKKLVTYIENEQKTCFNEGLDAKELCSKYTTENIATCAFGLEGQCFEDPNSEFREIGKSFSTPSISLAIKSILLTLLPALSGILKLQIFPEHVANRLRKIVLDTLEYRDKNNIVRNDFLQIMNDLKSKSTEYPFTNEDIISHAAGFFIDGFETSSISLSFALYELGCNTDAQNKLRNEINDKFKSNGGKLSYEDIQEMAYLDCVLNESLRLHPPALFLKKMCTRQYVLESPSGNGQDVVVEPGTSVVIPIIGLHMDPKYYPEPERFHPERFSKENKEKLVKSTFLTFGEGPRGCVGQRFAVLQVKLAVIYVIKNFEVKVNMKTKSPVQIDPLYFLLAAKGGLWLDFNKIDV